MKVIVLVLSLLALTACAPAHQTARPQIAVVNAPTEIRFPGLADAFAGALELPKGVELDSPEGRKIVRTRVDEVRRETLLRYRDGLLERPLRALADEVAAELAQLPQARN